MCQEEKNASAKYFFMLLSKFSLQTAEWLQQAVYRRLGTRLRWYSSTSYNCCCCHCRAKSAESLSLQWQQWSVGAPGLSPDHLSNRLGGRSFHNHSNHTRGPGNRSPRSSPAHPGPLVPGYTPRSPGPCHHPMPEWSGLGGWNHSQREFRVFVCVRGRLDTKSTRWKLDSVSRYCDCYQPS